MSEYFRRYIKREHYPNPPYMSWQVGPTSSSKHPSRIVSMTPSRHESGSRPGMKIGTSFGARKNKLTGYFRNIEYFLTWRSTISEVGTNYAGKICSTRISKSTSEDLINRTTRKNQTSMTFSLLLFFSQVNMLSSTSNSRGLRMITNFYGSWNLYLLC